MSETPRAILACPHCGAPLQAGALDQAATCSYCHVTSVPVPVRAPEVHEKGELSCPRCLLPLYEGRAPGAVLHGCGACGGIWMDNESAACALSTSLEAVKALAVRATANALASVPTAPPIGCPVCGKLLFRTQDPVAGVELDLCASHGTWFDRCELGVVLASRDVKPAHVLAPRSVPREYHGKVPDFRAGTPVDWDHASLVAGAAITLVGAVLSAAGSSEGERER